MRDAWRPTVWDVATAVSLALLVVADALFTLSHPPATGLVVSCGLLACAGLLGRTRQPVAAFLWVCAMGVLPTLVSATIPDFYGSFATLLAAVYTVGLRCTGRVVAVVPVAGAGVFVGFAARVPSFLTAGQVVGSVSGVVLAIAAGRTVRMLRDRADVEAERADMLERERLVRTREAVAAERERIALELHDVIAHDVAVMVIHAGAAERLLGTRRDDAARSLAQIQASGRKAVDELRLLLDMLREDEPIAGPRPGLASLPPLVEELARSGLPVTLEVSGERRDLAEPLDVSAYRLVQEALTNTLKHAPGSSARVVLDFGPDTLTTSVVNTAGGRVIAGLPPSGHGLLGMRERVRMFDGTMSAGPRPDGGWEVTAVLPIASGAP